MQPASRQHGGIASWQHGGIANPTQHHAKLETTCLLASEWVAFEQDALLSDARPSLETARTGALQSGSNTWRAQERSAVSQQLLWHSNLPTLDT
jgi:hypothetical protein